MDTVIGVFGVIGFATACATTAVLVIGKVNHVWPIIHTRHFTVTPESHDGFELNWERQES